MHRLVQDNDSHWYVIPDDKLPEWEEWRDIPGSDERSWELPDYATEVSGYQSVTFKEFFIN
jgi:hypothetical protein